MKEINSTISTNTSTTHGSENGLSSAPPYEDIAQLVPISLAIILINLLVFALFASKRRLRSPANCILLSLAVCDFITGFVNVPLFIIMAFTSIVPRPFTVPMHFTRMVLHNFTAISGVYHTLLVTAEKYVAITRPLAHLSRIQSRTVCKAITAVWGAAAVLACIPFAWYTERRQPQVIHMRHVRYLETAYLCTCIGLVFILPYTFITYAHVVMYKAISRRGRACAGNSRNTNKLRRNNINDKKTIFIFAVLAIVFLVCWLPWFILQLLYALGSAPDIVAHAFLIIRYLSSIINPLLYTFFKRNFQTAARELICRKRRASRTATHSRFHTSRSLANTTQSLLSKQRYLVTSL